MAGTRDQLDAMAPWDAASYFQTIKETFVTIAGSPPGILAVADPNRVAILFAAGAGFNSWVSTNPNAVNGQGLAMGTSLPPIQLVFAEVGPLVQAAWYGVANAQVSITVITISLARWPDVEREARRVQSATNPQSATGNGQQRGRAVAPGKRKA